MQQQNSIYSKIPPVQEIDQYLEAEGMTSGREIRSQIKDLLSEFRADKNWLGDESTTRESILEEIKTRLEQGRQQLMPVINGTGAIIHTNLGRSVFSKEILEEVSQIASSYTNLEFSLETGKRGARLSNVGGLLKTLTGAEEAVVVNNNAAAVLLSLITFAQQKEVIISRGELVEIGGSFRVPEIITVSGAILKEIGTTNRTKLKDYQNALSEETAVVLKVHTSNYQIVGFTESVSTAELSKVTAQSDAILMEDLGSGALFGFAHTTLNSEPLVSQVLKDGVDIVTVSGDKLLGGPQAGIILGKKKYLDQIKQHPLYRALRCDKITMLLLEKTLAAYANNEHNRQIPTQRMLNEAAETVKLKAEQVLKGLESERFELTPCHSTPGGGSLPGKAIPSWGIKLNFPDLSEEELLAKLRQTSPPIIGRIQEGRVLIDCRTVLPHQVVTLSNALSQIAKSPEQ